MPSCLTLACWTTFAVLPTVCAATSQAPTAMNVENDFLKLTVNTNGQTTEFLDRSNGVNHCRPGTPFARIKKGGKNYAASHAKYSDGLLALEFGPTNVTATLRITPKKQYVTAEVVSISSQQIEELALIDIRLTPPGDQKHSFAACVLALNLQTNVRAIPQSTQHLWAACYPRFGLIGAQIAIIGCPRDQLRGVMKEVILDADELPHSSIGGPWALESSNNYGSYLFDFGDLTEQTVDRWIALAHQLGVTQIDFHGGRSFRFGDFRPDPKLYPRGVASMKAVIDKLHDAGILAGLHTYAMFMDKKCPYVTPIPDARLGKDATFTLAADVAKQSEIVPVTESTESMSAITGFAVRNSVTLQIDDELITYSDIANKPPYAFTQCTRGACGTAIAPHAKGTPVHHLRECFGRFCPDGDSTLFTEVAANTAALYNNAGFDMIYLDALDGGDAVAGREFAWHYQSKFTFEICRRLNRPAIMEMSTFHHHLWYVRSRMGAWDHPNRSHKKFIDLHCAANAALGRQFLPGNLGWWSFKTWQGINGDPTHTDDIEYLCSKALAHNYGLSLMGINPSTVQKTPALPRLAAIVRRYEHLRNANYFSDAVKEKLRQPGAEFRLVHARDGQWEFHPTHYDKQKARSENGHFDSWTIDNQFTEQPLRLRIETLTSVAAYDAPNGITIAEFNDLDAFSDRATQSGISANLRASSARTKGGALSGVFTATHSTGSPNRSWCKVGARFAPPLDLGQQPALGVWVYGDGKGEVLNVQQTSPTHLSHAIADHYIAIDFTGWRYFELVEPEGARHADYTWPYGNIYSIYRESIRPSSVETLSLWYNNLPVDDTVECYLSPIRALPTESSKLHHPSITIGGKTITLPVDIETGQFLEFRGMEDCTLYGRQGEEICKVQPTGQTPRLMPGENEIGMSSKQQGTVTSRVRVTVITEGTAFRGTNRPDLINGDFLRDD